MTLPLQRPDASAVEPVVLGGSRVRLEPLQPGHLDALLDAANETDAETFPLTTVHRDRAGMRGWIETALRLAEAKNAVPFATVDLGSGRVVGSTRFANLERWDWPRPVRPRGSPDAVEIGWTWLAASAQRTGINVEAKLLMLRHAFERWRVFRVHLKTDARNQRSRLAIEGLGASLDGILRSHLPTGDGNAVRDSAWYSILDEEWPAVEARLRARLERPR